MQNAVVAVDIDDALTNQIELWKQVFGYSFVNDEKMDPVFSVVDKLDALLVAFMTKKTLYAVKM